MSELLYSVVWDSTTNYKIPLKTGTAVGTNIVVTYQNHWLETGDIVTVTAAAGFTAYAATNVSVTKVDADTFIYPVGSAPGIAFPSSIPGRTNVLWLTCAKYSTPLTAPHKVRLEALPAGTTVDVQTLDDDGIWTTHETVESADSHTDLIYDVVYKTARLRRASGTGTPVAKSARINAPDFVPNPTTTFHIPFDPETGGELPDVGTPGTYDLVTTNEKGQVVAGVTASEAGANIYAEFTNAGSLNIPKGAPVKKLSSTTIERAQGTATKRMVIDLAAETINMGETGTVILEGILEATAGEWQMVTDVGGGLEADGNPYFLSWSTAGMMLKTINIDTAPPDTYLVGLGYGVSPTEFKIEIEQPIKIS